VNTPAGWYPDAQDTTKLRYWNGTRWTDHTAPAEVDGELAQEGAPAVPGAPADTSSPVTSAPAETAAVPLLRRRYVLPSAAGLALVVGIALGAGVSGEDATASPEYQALHSELSDATARADRAASDLEDTKDQLATIQGDLPAREAALEQGQDALASAQDQLEEDQAQLATDRADVTKREKAVGADEHQIAANTIGGDGVYEVGVDMRAGTYKSVDNQDCYYAVNGDANGNDILNNNIVSGPAVVTVPAGTFFETTRCGDWVMQE
jgi:hypothetical protein